MSDADRKDRLPHRSGAGRDENSAAHLRWVPVRELLQMRPESPADEASELDEAGGCDSSRDLRSASLKDLAERIIGKIVRRLYGIQTNGRSGKANDSDRNKPQADGRIAGREETQSQGEKND